MREILFRGKRTDNSEWIEGYYAIQSNHACFAHELKYTHFIFKDIFLDFNLGGLQEFEVIPETVGQYTGLTDSNGKKIYEGDICCFREWTNGDMCWIGKVYYEHQQFVISGNKNKECEMSFTLAMSRFIPENIEIIGNIHDNPELLERGQ